MGGKEKIHILRDPAANTVHWENTVGECLKVRTFFFKDVNHSDNRSIIFMAVLMMMTIIMMMIKIMIIMTIIIVMVMVMVMVIVYLYSW